MVMKNNVIIRTLTGVGFIVVMVAGICCGPLWYALLFATITGMATWEFCGIINDNKGCQVNRLITTVASVYLFGATFAFSTNVTGTEIFIPYLVTTIYLLISELYFKDNNTLTNWAFTFMSQLYIALPFASLNAIAIYDQGGTVMYLPVFILSIFIFLWSSDTGAFCFGSMLGRNKLFPRISPNKSWEGVFGGALVALIASQVVASFSNDFCPQNELINRVEWAGLAVVVVVFGTWGDLVESLLKRRLGIKDSGNILPGHGGMLDRFDSALLAIPSAVVYVYTILMLIHK